MTTEAITTPGLRELIESIVDAKIANIHTGMPARVVKYDKATQTVDVQPSLLRVYKNEDGEEVAERRPQLQKVPVWFPSAGGWMMSWDIQPGDSVWLQFSSRALDYWWASKPGTDVDPVFNRKHDINDAVAFPGIRQRDAALEQLSEDFYIGREDGSTRIVLKSDGTITIEGGTIEIGSGASQKAVLGDELKAFLMTLKSPSGTTGGPLLAGPGAGSAITGAGDLISTLLSQKVKVAP